MIAFSSGYVEMRLLFSSFWACAVLAISLGWLPAVQGQDSDDFLTVYNLVYNEFEQTQAKTIVRLAFHDGGFLTCPYENLTAARRISNSLFP